MIKKLLYKFEQIKTSFWFLPLTLVLIGVVTAFLFIYLDSIVDFKIDGFFTPFFTGSSDSARSVLSSISGAMIGVAGTVFSITLVVLTLASNQFGPRLLRNFMYKRINQVVLGVYVSTYLYCLIVLNSVRGNDSITFVPNLSVSFALVLAFISIVLLILFIHNVSTSIQPSSVVSSIASELERNVNNLFHSDLGQALDYNFEERLAEVKEEYKIHTQLVSPKSGYLQFIVGNSMLEVAKKHDIVISVLKKPGEYLVKGVVIVEVYSKKELEDAVKDKIIDKFFLEKGKSAFQDAEFSIHQIVEIASKALSPGINDPYTAIICIDNLTSTLSYLTKVEFPSKFRNDENDNLRIIAETITFKSMVDASFNQIRQYGATSCAILIRLMESFITIYEFADDREEKRVIETHAKMVLETAEKNLNNKHDYLDFMERYSEFKLKIIEQ